MNRTQRQRFVSNASKEQRWILSYALFLTLLVAFFVMLFSVSSLEPDKFAQVRSTLAHIFDVRASLAEPQAYTPARPPDAMPATQVDLQPSLSAIQQQLEQRFAQSIEQQLLSVSGNTSWIEIQIADSITFSPDSADIKSSAGAILYEVGRLLASVKLPVIVEGYSERQESDSSIVGWQLSAQRAVNVLSYLQGAGIQGQRLSARAFAHGQSPRSGERVALGKIAIVVAGFGISVRDAGF
ncbi:OmpA family protein [Reinekea sp.]|jgi:chemotaxis protein MotB|uniref:OmpA family protein n=1 Tax=Reinekea sp. TaxID=1970455 RepID=UPI002A83779F|nr:OmpA family protein [Reinekea sp.]